MSTPVSLVIFDCDGALVDSERLAVRVEAALITSLGWGLSEDDVLERFVGRSDAYMLGEIEQALGIHLPRASSDEFPVDQAISGLLLTRGR
ncbi:MAG TPA: hypothetical protein VGH94_10465 [Acidimicrobiales bacterium]